MSNSVPVYPWESLKIPWFCKHLDFAETYLGKMLFNFNTLIPTVPLTISHHPFSFLIG